MLAYRVREPGDVGCNRCGRIRNRDGPWGRVGRVVSQHGAMPHRGRAADARQYRAPLMAMAFDCMKRASNGQETLPEG